MGCSPSRISDSTPIHPDSTIVIKSSNGTDATDLDVSLSYTIQAIKLQIQEKEGTSVNQQRLLFGEELLVDNKTLSDYGIQQSATLRLEVCDSVEKLMINVRTTTGKTIIQEVEPSDTVESFLSKISLGDGELPLSQQTVIFGGQVLEGKRKMLADYNVLNGTTLYLMPSRKRSVQFPVELCKWIAEEGSNLSLHTEKTITLEVEYSDMIDEIKSKVQDMEGIPSEKLFFLQGMNSGSGDTVFDYYNSCSGTFKLLVREPLRDNNGSSMKIYIRTLSGEEIELDVFSLDSIAFVKDELRWKQGFAPDVQKLVFDGKQLEDDRTLSDYNILNESTVHLILNLRGGHDMQIFVKTLTGKAISLKADLRDRIKAIKAKIEEKEQIPSSQQELVFAGEHLEDRKTLAYYKIVNESVLRLASKGDEVTGPDIGPSLIIITNQRTQNAIGVVDFQPCWTILDLKMRVFCDYGIPSDKLNLFYANESSLQDGKTFSHYDIHEDCVLAFRLSKAWLTR